MAGVYRDSVVLVEPLVYGKTSRRRRKEVLPVRKTVMANGATAEFARKKTKPPIAVSMMEGIGAVTGISMMTTS